MRGCPAGSFGMLLSETWMMASSSFPSVCVFDSAPFTHTAKTIIKSRSKSRVSFFAEQNDAIMALIVYIL